MRPTYAEELAVLGKTYATARTWDAAELRKALVRLAAGPASLIASGGMVAVSTLAARLHAEATLEPGQPVTPLGAIWQPATSSGAVLFTSSGKHPDAVEVMRRLGRPGLRPAIVLTHRSEGELDVSPDVEVISLPALPLREGFLAVNSIMSMAVATIRGYMGEALPERLAAADVDPWPVEVDRVLVLHPPRLAAVAADLETRASEIGLAAVQVADYRNFAHGRHTGLERTIDRTTIVALSDGDSRDLADATLSVLPAATNIVRWHSSAAWPAGALSLLIASMEACGELGDRQGVSLARPKVPVFGRRLYRLPIRRRLPDVRLGPVERKLAAAGSVEDAELRDEYGQALAQWREDVATVPFGGVVLDYDGTVCSTGARFHPARPEVAAVLNDLLAKGIRIGFASGRGPSLHRDLRKVLDQGLWDRVDVGLYNGSVLCRLDEDLEDLREPSDLIAKAGRRVAELPIAHLLDPAPRRTQLTVEAKGEAQLKPAAMADAVIDALARAPALPVKVVRSGHSLDVVAQSTSKLAVVRRLRESTGERPVLSIGDQGQINGNDHELLAAEPWSLTVDRCSADPSRCWYLGDGSLSGPDLLLRYMKAFRPRKDGAVLKVGTL